MSNKAYSEAETLAIKHAMDGDFTESIEILIKIINEQSERIDKLEKKVIPIVHANTRLGF